MGACAILPRIIGQSRASELLYTGRFMTADEGEKWGFFSRIVAPAEVLAQAEGLAREIAQGPTFANTMTKRMLAMEWAMSVEEAIESEAIAQALCMTTADFTRAFEAFARKEKPVFRGELGPAGPDRGLPGNCFRLKINSGSIETHQSRRWRLHADRDHRWRTRRPVCGDPPQEAAAQAEITVYERNRADDTFGFGVVFSDATLDNFEKYDPPSYRRITDEFAYWDDIAIHFKGTVHRVGGNGFCGCSRRTLLLILQNGRANSASIFCSRPRWRTKAALPTPT